MNVENMNIENGKVITMNTEQLQRSGLLCFAAQLLGVENEDYKFIPIPLVAVGTVSTGKSEAFRDIAKKLHTDARPCSYWHNSASTHERDDFAGMPSVATGELKFHQLHDCWNTEKFGVYNIDEVDRAQSPAEQNAAQCIMLERHIKNNELSPYCWVCGTMNGASDMYTLELSQSYRTRIGTVFVSNSAAGQAESFQDWSRGKGINPIIRGFASFYPCPPVEFEYAEFAEDHPRTRIMAGRILEAADTVKFETGDILLPVLSGFVGKECALRMMGYKEIWENAPLPEDVFADPMGTALPDRQDVLYALSCALCDHIERHDNGTRQKLAVAAFQYLARSTEPEPVAFAVRRIRDSFPRLVVTKEYQKWANSKGTAEILGLIA